MSNKSTNQSQYFKANKLKKVEQKRLIYQIIREPVFNIIDDCFSSIGMLQVSWLDSAGKIKIMTYGTAFAIHQRLIVTCLHNIWAPSIRSYCSKAFFIPNIKNQVVSSCKVYETNKKYFYQCKELQYSIANAPQREELVILLLAEELPNKRFLQVSSGIDLKVGSPLEIVGYPSESYFDCEDFGKVVSNRNELKGTLHSINDCCINHTMVKTQIGNSGSPMLVRNQKGEYEVIGMHTHKSSSPHFKSGLLFTPDILQKIEIYKKQLMREVASNLIGSIEEKVCALENATNSFKFEDQKIESNSQVHNQLYSQNQEGSISNSSIFNQESDDQSSSNQSSERSQSFRDFALKMLSHESDSESYQNSFSLNSFKDNYAAKF